MSLTDIRDENVQVAFPVGGSKSVKIGPAKRQLRQVDLDSFTMRRLDVLEKLNQETYRKLQT